MAGDVGDAVSAVSRVPVPPRYPPPAWLVERASLDLWLSGLHPRGCLLVYGDAFSRHYGSLGAVARTWRGGDPKGRSIVDAVDVGIWELVGISKTGHKLLVARGIAALNGFVDV